MMSLNSSRDKKDKRQRKMKRGIKARLIIKQSQAASF